MSLVSSYADSLYRMGLESPSSKEFVDHPDLRTIAAFFLGWTFIACLRYLTLAILRHPITEHLLRAALQRPILFTIAERQEKASDPEGNYVQRWLRNTLQGPVKHQPDRPEGTRHLSVVLTAAFTLAVFMNFLSLLDFRSSKQDVLCIVVIAWAGISVSCAKLAGLLRITFDLQRLGAGTVERLAAWIVLGLSFGATLAHVTISIGATRDVPQIPNLSLCYRRHFLPTALTVSMLNIALELYFMGRTFFLLVPPFLQFQHQVEIMMDVRVARVASILVLDLMMILPSARSFNVAAEFIPFSLGALLVLAAFNHHPPKPTDSNSWQMSASHRTSVVTFPRNKGSDRQSVISNDEPQAELDKPATTGAPQQAPSRKASLISEHGRNQHTRSKSRALSRASHISYDSEAEARSVRGAIVSFAFKSHEIEPMPAIPYGIYQPKLVGSPRFLPRASQSQASAFTSDSESRVHSGSVAPPSPLSRQPEISASEQKSLPLPKPSTSANHLSATKNSSRQLGSPSGSSVVYGSDVVRQTGPQKPELARRESSSTMKSVSHITSSHTSQGYTGPDLGHYSMSSPATYEARDYLDVSPRATGLFRTSAFGAAPRANVSRSGSESASASPPSTGGGASRGSPLGTRGSGRAKV